MLEGRDLQDDKLVRHCDAEGDLLLYQTTNYYGFNFPPPEGEYLWKIKADGTLSEGFNVHGICSNKNCRVYKENFGELVLGKGFGSFNVDEMQEDKLPCSCCGLPIKMIGFGFYECSWTYEYFSVIDREFTCGGGNARGCIYKRTFNGCPVDYGILSIDVREASRQLF